MKLKCIASNTEWFTRGNTYQQVPNRYGTDLVYDKDGDEWIVTYVEIGLWVVDDNAVFRDVGE